MKRFMTICAALAIALFAAPAADAADTYAYGWTISESTTNAFVNSGAFVGGVQNLYLWFECNVKDGMSAAEFDLQSVNPANLILGFNVMNGYLNAGTATELLLAVGGCPNAPVVAGQILTLQNAPGEYCIVPSQATGTNGTVDCRAAPELHNNRTTGYTNAGGLPNCDERNPGLCNVTSVDASSWGQIKGLYR